MNRPDVDRTEGNRFVAAGALLAGLGVAAGAFGAHALRSKVPDASLAVWHTGAEYQMYHALALVVVGRLLARNPARLLRMTGWLFVVGIVLFSGSLYGLALSASPAFGPLTPIGGACFLAGWACLALAALRHPRA